MRKGTRLLAVLAATIIIVVAIILTTPNPANARQTTVSQASRLEHCATLRVGPRDQQWRIRNACKIIVIFPAAHGQDAVTVAWCEGSLSPRAKNGQYLGTFQMGTGERAKYGHGPTVIHQTRAAYRYFIVARRIGWGRGWGPWSCKPGSYDNRKAWRRAPRSLVHYVYG